MRIAGDPSVIARSPCDEAIQGLERVHEWRVDPRGRGGRATGISGMVGWPLARLSFIPQSFRAASLEIGSIARLFKVL